MPLTDEDPRILLIGLQSISGLPSIDWRDIEGANPADYDNVVINIVSLVSHLQSFVSVNQDMFKERRGELDRLGERVAKLLASDGTGIVVCPGEHYVYWEDTNFPASVTKPRTRDYDCLDWLPIRIQMEYEHGTTLDVNEEGWSRYFCRIKRWDFYFKISPDAPEKFHGWGDVFPEVNYVRASTDIIGSSRAGEAIGICVYLACFQRAQKGAIRSPLDTIFPMGDKHLYTQGHLYLVPPPTDGDVSEAVKVLLEDMFSLTFKTEAPIWADTIDIPGLAGIDKQIRTTEKERSKLEKQLEELNKERGTKAQWRGLLYETGQVLQDLCEEAFKELGVATRPSEVSDEFVVVMDSKEMLIEVKGIKKSASKDDLGQLIIDSEQRDKEYDKRALVVNAWRKTAPKGRGGGGKPWFPHNIIEAAIPLGVALISTDQLLAALSEHWKSGNGADLVRKMMTTVGLFQV